MRKGTLCRVAEVQIEGSGSIVLTDDGSVFAVVGTPALLPGMAFQVGPVCGDWCFLIWENQRWRARILRTGVANDTHAQVSPG